MRATFRRLFRSRIAGCHWWLVHQCFAWLPSCFAICAFLVATRTIPAATPDPGIERPLVLNYSDRNPRNSEGDFIKLKDGRILYVYTHFTDGGYDESSAHLAGRYSSDQGKTWTTEDTLVLPNEGGQNVMSVSFLRLESGPIALFYLRKNSITDCRPLMRTSSDEARTWSKPTLCIDEVGYNVLNNGRAVQLKSGRIVLPIGWHNRPGQKRPDWNGEIMCYLSDDEGRTWRRSKSVMKGYAEGGKRIATQEPGVVELKDGRLMMFVRSDAGSQQLSYSSDGGDTWSPLKSSNIIAPLAPASIKRIPKTGDLLLVWINHENISPALRGKRTPLCVAISRDEGRTWERTKPIEDDPLGWYGYTAIFFTDDDHVLLSHGAGHWPEKRLLATTQITRFSLDWLYRRK